MNGTDLLVLTNIIESLIARVRAANALRQKLTEEARGLTAEELASLQSDDDAARLSLQSAIDKALADGK